MNINALWIGDKVFVKSLGENASWEGLEGSMHARLRHKGRIIIVEISDLEEELKSEFKDPRLVKLEDELKSDRSVADKVYDKSNTKIDLHIEKLNPSLIHAIPQHILNHQMTRAKLFIDDAIKSRLLMITLVHGKGKGALGMELKNLLQNIPEVNQVHEINDGGALEVWLSY